jgi:hypothetical protein
MIRILPIPCLQFPYGGGINRNFKSEKPPAIPEKIEKPCAAVLGKK